MIIIMYTHKKKTENSLSLSFSIWENKNIISVAGWRIELILSNNEIFPRSSLSLSLSLSLSFSGFPSIHPSI